MSWMMATMYYYTSSTGYFIQEEEDVDLNDWECFECVLEEGILPKYVASVI